MDRAVHLLARRRSTPWVCALLFVSVFCRDLAGQEQRLKLFAQDGVAGDGFGSAVAISGTTTVVGASLHDGNGTDSGAAYAFDAVSGLQLDKLEPGPLFGGFLLGDAIAIEGQTVLVGSYASSQNGMGSGSAHLFDLSTGLKTASLLPGDGAAFDGFGSALDLDGATAIVGAFGDDDDGQSSGAAYLFDAASGQELLKLGPSEGDAGDQFGFAVAIQGSIALVGAPQDEEAGVGSGSAYLFDTSTGQELARWVPANGAEGDRFGTAVALEGSTAFVGAPGHGGSGAVFLFDVDSGQELDVLLPVGAFAQSDFGAALAVDGASALVGAPTYRSAQLPVGTVVLFDLVDRTQVAELLPAAGVDGQVYGASVALAGTRAVVGHSTDGEFGPAAGAAFVFDLTAVDSDPIDAAFEAVSAAFNGTGVNPVLFSTPDRPLLGTTWTGLVDGGAIGASTGTTVVVGVEDELDAGVLLAAGELLVDLGSPLALVSVASLTAGQAAHPQAIPNDPTLIGRTISLQSLVGPSPAGLALTNGLRLTFGTL